MTRILMNRWFQRFSDKERIGTAALMRQSSGPTAV